MINMWGIIDDKADNNDFIMIINAFINILISYFGKWKISHNEIANKI